MFNALGRLIDTLLSGWVYQAHGMVACLCDFRHFSPASCFGLT